MTTIPRAKLPASLSAATVPIPSSSSGKEGSHKKCSRFCFRHGASMAYWVVARQGQRLNPLDSCTGPHRDVAESPRSPAGHVVAVDLDAIDATKI